MHERSIRIISREPNIYFTTKKVCCIVHKSLYKLGKYEKAETTFTNQIDINSDYPAVYLNRGLCRFFQSDQSGACKDFKSLNKLGLDPKSINDEKVSTYVKENCAS